MLAELDGQGWALVIAAIGTAVSLIITSVVQIVLSSRRETARQKREDQLEDARIARETNLEDARITRESVIAAHVVEVKKQQAVAASKVDEVKKTLSETLDSQTAKLDEIHLQTNGMSEKLQALAKQAGRDEQKAADAKV